jgi:hypothetical protein
MKILTALERVAIWHVALDYHSPDQRPFQLKDHVPSDLDFLEPGSNQSKYTGQTPGFPGIEAWDSTPTGKWFHVSPHPLQPGTKLTPQGGKGLDTGGFNFLGPDSPYRSRGNQVWISPNFDKARMWMHYMGPESHVYEVHPGDTPQPWNASGAEGYVTPHATVTREVTPPRRERRHPESWT